MELAEPQLELFKNSQFSSFPGTRYMGSKNKLISEIWGVLQDIEFETAIDAFSGSGVVSYFLKSRGKEVYSNDFLSFSSHISKALVENAEIKISSAELDFLVSSSTNKSRFISDTFKGIYFTDTENSFLDSLRHNINYLDNSFKKSLAISAISRSCLKRRPRGIFTYVGNRYDDGRNDLKKDLKEHFVENIKAFNDAVFNNKKNNKTYNEDVFNLKCNADLVYLDPPYLNPKSDNDYIRRYHFVEGLSRNWEGVEIQEHTKTKKFKRYKSLFDSKSTVYTAFDKLFKKYENSIIVVSYSSNSLPTKDEMIVLLKKYKQSVEVKEIDYTYTFGTQSHKVGNNANRVKEYLFVGR